MSDKALSYSEVLLGNAMETILDATDSTIPKIRESDFVNNVLPLLARPFKHESLVRYVAVVGELTNPLRVYADINPDNILFEVPAFIQSSLTTVPTGTAASAEVTMRAIYSEGERGVDINPYIANFFKNITRTPDLRASVLDPLRVILERYGRTIDITDDNEVALAPVPASVTEAAVDGSTFTDEYE